MYFTTDRCIYIATVQCYLTLKNFTSLLSCSDTVIRPFAVSASMLIVAVSSCIDAVVCWADAAFSSEMADRLETTSLICFLASSHEPALFLIPAVSFLDTAIPSLTSIKLFFVASSFPTCSCIRTFVLFISSTVFSDSD